MITSIAELSSALKAAQACRAAEIRCEISAALAAQMPDTALMEMLVLALSMAQGVQQRMIRSRGKGAVITAKIRYRQGLRMLEGERLTAEESAALEMARRIAADVPVHDEEECFCSIYQWICEHVRYTHTAPGRKGYERLVGAAGALLDGQANCQGYADVLYLLCGLCGIACEYRVGRGERHLHVWNAVYLKGEWREADASKGARALRHPEQPMA